MCCVLIGRSVTEMFGSCSAMGADISKTSGVLYFQWSSSGPSQSHMNGSHCESTVLQLSLHHASVDWGPVARHLRLPKWRSRSGRSV